MQLVSVNRALKELQNIIPTSLFITSAVDTVSDANTSSHPLIVCSGEVQDAYVIAKEKDLPKLHRAVWKGDLTKVKQLTKNVKESELNARDKEERWEYAAPQLSRTYTSYPPSFSPPSSSSPSPPSPPSSSPPSLPSSSPPSYRTPLHLACARGHGRIIIHFCAQKANTNVVDSDGRTPMHKVAHPVCLVGQQYAKNLDIFILNGR